MANTKKTMLDALVTALTGTSGITTCTRQLLKPSAAVSGAPYVGVLSAEEVKLVNDGTNIKFKLLVDLILVCATDTIEELIDIVKDAMLDGMATTISAMDIHFTGTEPTNHVDTHDNTSTRMVFEIIYYSEKGAA